MRTLFALVLIGCVLAACGDTNPVTEPDTPALKGKLRVEYYEISKQ